MRLNSHVEQIVVEDGRAAGVRVNGRTIRARRAVISNADMWNTRRLVDAAAAPAFAKDMREREASVDRCASFLHLHLGPE